MAAMIEGGRFCALKSFCWPMWWAKAICPRMTYHNTYTYMQHRATKTNSPSLSIGDMRKMESGEGKCQET